MSERVKFSIITPSFNQGRFIQECIESVRGQEGVEVEHIIIDGVSTDGTQDILKMYSHLQWVSEPDQGQTDAINKGFLRATGDWLMWLNGDDFLLPGALQRVLRFSIAHPDADVIFGDCTFVGEHNRGIRTKREYGFDWKMLLFYGCYIPSTAAFYRRHIVSSGCLLDPWYRVCMDYEYYLRIAHAGFRFVHMPSPLACFRFHETNISKVQSQRKKEEMRKLQRHYLQRNGMSYLGNEWILRFLCRLYQVKRVWSRLWNHDRFSEDWNR